MDLQEKMDFLAGCESGYVTDALRKLGLSGWIDGAYPVQEGATFVGEVYPAGYSYVAGDEQVYSLYEMVDMCPPGKVLVMTGVHDMSVLGGNVYRSAQNKGIKAIVVEGRCRDIAEMRKGTMPIFCEGPKTRLPDPKLRITSVGKPVVCQGQKLCPGDIMVGDADGVVFIPREHFDKVFEYVQKIAEVEDQCAKALDENAPVTEIGRLMKIKNSIGK